MNTAKVSEPDPLRPMRDMDRAELEALASGITSTPGSAYPLQSGRARAELKLRDREFAELQEKSRREFETALADKQLSAATNVALATKWAMWAAIASGAAAIVQAVVALHHW